jgi:hypothetical protein
MMKGKDKTFYFKVKDGSKTEILSRDEVVEKDPISLIVFYENNLKFTQPK